MNLRLHLAVANLVALALWLPAQASTGCNTDADQTKAVSAYALSGQGNFSCGSLNMSPALVRVTKPSVLGGTGVDWSLTDAQEVDVVTVADSSGKRCVYNYAPGATGGRGLTPNSSKPATQVVACKDGNVIPPPNSPPTLEILLPLDGTPFPGGVAIELKATSTDAQDDPDPTITWYSSIEGALGESVSGGSLLKTLRAGAHVITAQAQDAGGLLGADEVTVTVTAVVVSQCETIEGGEAVLINGTRIECPVDGGPRVVCSADISEAADKFELVRQGCCVCGAVARECNPELPLDAVVEVGQPGPCPAIKENPGTLQVPTTILFNNDPYYCLTTGGSRTCYAY